MFGLDIWYQGSSPRVWGQGVCEIIRPSVFGIIPTRVGTRAISPDNALGCKDHPHACGDKRCARSYFNPYGGSSPRVWGQAARNIKITDNVRIIPTRVGTRTLCLGLIYGIRDHPHACGDKKYNRADNKLTWGSSPRVWGQGCR